MSAAEREAPARSRTMLAVGSVLAACWFSSMFFVMFPALVLWGSGASFWPPPGPNRWLGAALLLAAHALLVAPVRAFIVEGRGTQLPIAPPGALVRSGFYTRVRNPMYSLYFAIVLAEAVLYRSLPLFAYALVFFAIEHGYVVAFEEKELRRRFGADYEAYCERVGRWLPRRGRSA